VLDGEKILVTGISGTIGRALASSLVDHNEVWGAARFRDQATRDAFEALGVVTAQVDVGAGDLAALPTDFTYVVHLAYFRGGNDDFDHAVTVNGEGTGLVLEHCRRAKAALVMSSNVVYAPSEDPWYLPHELDPIGGSNVPWTPTSGTSKVAEEAVARYCARALDLPVTIARLNTVYGDGDMLLPVMHMDAIVAGNEVVQRWDPNPHTPIHTDDLCAQLDAMLDAARAPATIVNWGGDEVITVEEWCRLTGELAGVPVHLSTRPVPNTTRGGGCDPTKRRSITGPCGVTFADGFRAVYASRHGGGASGVAS
jgi:nucleoside-diphosphate-sugar epimerase